MSARRKTKTAANLNKKRQLADAMETEQMKNTTVVDVPMNKRRRLNKKQPSLTKKTMKQSKRKSSKKSVTKSQMKNKPSKSIKLFLKKKYQGKGTSIQTVQKTGGILFYVKV